MEDNFPILNIPMLFTQYRTRILEESGQHWFHPENQPGFRASSSPSQNESDDLPKELDKVAEDRSPALSLAPDLAPLPELPTRLETPSKRIEPAIQSSLEHSPSLTYEHLDPWDNPHPEDIVDPQGVSTTEFPPSIAVDISMGQPQDVLDSNQRLPIVKSTEALNADTSDQSVEPILPSETRSEHPSREVNLFPIEDFEIHEQDGTSLYDLTEFYNGEIEVPPVAVRDSQVAKFEKVVHPLNADLKVDAHASNDEHSSETPRSSELSSAEIAKHRLRNCL